MISVPSEILPWWRDNFYVDSLSSFSSHVPNSYDIYRQITGLAKDILFIFLIPFAYLVCFNREVVANSPIKCRRWTGFVDMLYYYMWGLSWLCWVFRSKLLMLPCRHEWHLDIRCFPNFFHVFSRCSQNLFHVFCCSLIGEFRCFTPCKCTHIDTQNYSQPSLGMAKH